jgi:predicted transcriptional regulator
MTTKSIVDDVGLPKEQLDLVEHFEADYNTIDHLLRKALGSNKQVSFTHLVNEFSRNHAGWRDADFLRTIAELRNLIVHGKTEAYRYLAVPTAAIAQNLQACRDRLVNPARVIPTFQRKVETVSIDDNLTRVLKIITQREYSQFPVYEAERFRGLLTENGITRWLAHHVATQLSLVELDEVPVRQVLRNEEKRKNYQFVARDTLVDDVSGLFESQELLEAVLITASGRESEKLLGIATRWDMIHFK